MNSLGRIVIKNCYTRCIHTCVSLLREKPKNLKGKKHSSQLWLERQLRDPYVELAKQENYRCRSAFKLLEMNEKLNVFNFGDVVIDCGAAPGSWTQVAVKLVNAKGKENGPVGKVIGVDKLPIQPIEGATVFGNMDFTVPETHKKLLEFLKEDKANIVLSDIAPNATGIGEMDHDNIIKLVYIVMKFAFQIMHKDGTFIAKVWDGSKTTQLQNDLAKFYKKIKLARPNATRSESSETYIVARGFKGIKVSSPGA